VGAAFDTFVAAASPPGITPSTPSTLLRTVDRAVHRWNDPVFREAYTHLRQQAPNAPPHEVEELIVKTLHTETGAHGEATPKLYRLRGLMAQLQEGLVLEANPAPRVNLLDTPPKDANLSMLQSYLHARSESAAREHLSRQIGTSMQRMLHISTNAGYGARAEASEYISPADAGRKLLADLEPHHVNLLTGKDPEPEPTMKTRSPWISVEEEKRVQLSLQHERHTELLILKVAFLVIFLAILVWSLVLQFSNTSNGASVPAEMRIAQLAIETLVYAGFAVMLLTSFNTDEQGFFGLPHPSDQFFAMFAGIVFGINAIKYLVETIQFTVETYSPTNDL